MLKDRVLQYRIDHQHQRRQHTRKQRPRPFLFEQRHHRRNRRRLLRRAVRLCAWRGQAAGGRRRGAGGLRSARRHARVDDPDGVRDQHGRGAGDRAREHGFQRRQLGAGAGGADGGAFEVGAGPFVPWARV